MAMASKDLALATTTSNVSILLGDGTGNFSPATNLGPGFGDGPDVVAVGDVNGDGKQDLALANLNSNNVAILLGNCPCQTPAAPSNTVATAISSSQITVTWNDNSTNETGFRIQRSRNGRGWAFLAVVPGNTNTYTDNGLPPGTTRYYRVGVFNACGFANNLTPASATTLP